MNRHLTNATVGAALLMSVACLRQETTHTLYMTSDGAVTWTVIERDIRSDAGQPADRDREEQEFSARLAAGLHPVPLGFRQLEADDVRVRMLRRERPFAVMTESKFARVELLIERLLAELKVPGTVTLTRSALTTTLTVVIESPGESDPSDEDAPVMAIVDVAAPYKVALTRGRFVAAAGFTIESDGAIAALDVEAFESLSGPGSTARFSLTWTNVH